MVAGPSPRRAQARLVLFIKKCAVKAVQGMLCALRAKIQCLVLRRMGHLSKHVKKDLFRIASNREANLQSALMSATRPIELLLARCPYATALIDCSVISSAITAAAMHGQGLQEQ